MIFKKNFYFLFLVMFIFTACGGGGGSEKTHTTTAPILSNHFDVVATNAIAISPITFANAGDRVTSCSVTPSLPRGLSLQSNCAISGTPTVNQSVTTYTVKGRNSGGTDTATVNLSVVENTATEVTLSGKVTYDFVPFISGGKSGLDYNNIVKKPVRGAVVEIVDDFGQTVGTTSTDANGNYSFKVKETKVKVRVLAQLYKKVSNGKSSWDFQVKDNTNSNSLYGMEGSLASLGSNSTQTRNLNASSGWTGNSYGRTRVAAPFAILDVIYKAVQKVTSAQSDAVFDPLNIFWSKNNISSTSENIEIGEIITSHYNGTALYILGKEDSDTDEYDSAIIAHEWGHYYEAKFSRSDSIGGMHSGGDILDIRIAFGEGFGDAMGSIINDNPLYLDSLGNEQSTTGVYMDLEDGGSGTNPGWYSELSIARILYDVYDSHDDAGDTLSLGFNAIHKVFTNEEKNTPAFTSIFTFISALKAEYPGNDTAINALTSNESIAPITDIYGTSRTNRVQNANPLYSTLSVGGTVDFVTNYSAVASAQGNKLGAYNLVSFTVPSAGTYTINVSQVGESGTPDPDMYLYYGSSNQPVAVAEAVGKTESITAFLNAGTYRMAVIVYGQSSGKTFSVTLN